MAPADDGSYHAAVRATISPERLARTQASAVNLIASGIAQQALGVGAQAPDFALPDSFGNPVALAELRAAGPVVLTFYRGAWCPYCNLQLQAYQRILPQIQASGATLVAVSPQLPDHSLSLIEKHALGFPVLSDSGNQIARQYGLVFPLDAATQQRYRDTGTDLVALNGDDSWTLPMPGSFIIDRTGVIRLAFVQADYTQRLEPTTILAALAALKG
jgi:peroxiredoxin